MLSKVPILNATSHCFSASLPITYLRALAFPLSHSVIFGDRSVVWPYRSFWSFEALHCAHPGGAVAEYAHTRSYWLGAECVGRLSRPSVGLEGSEGRATG